jgi:protein SCO1/2
MTISESQRKTIRRSLIPATGLSMLFLMSLAFWPRAAVAHDDGSSLPPGLREVGFDPPLSAPIPRDLVFRDETGRSIRLGDYLAGKPVILEMVYYNCSVLCDESLESLARTLHTLPAEMSNGSEVVIVSFDPAETPAIALAKKRDLFARHRQLGSPTNWHFLTGSESAIAQLTRAIGFRYAYDAAARSYSHATGVLVVTPDGAISRYLDGIDFASRDLGLALTEASAGKIGSPIDHLLLFCFQYNPAAARYSAAVQRLLQAGGVVTIACIGLFLVLLRRREKPATRNPRMRRHS